MGFISDKDLFEFDLNGYIVFKNFLPLETVEEMNRSIDSTEEGAKIHKFKFITKHELFFQLLTDDRILEICDQWIHPYFRFDHAWGVQHFPNDNDAHENIHGGNFAEQGFFQYHWNKKRPVCSCLIFTFPLEAQSPDKGGFALLPGSHKTHLDIDGAHVFKKYLGGKIKENSFVKIPHLEKGDMLVFTETLLHGTAEWKDAHRKRRNIYYKYCLGSMGWLPQDNPEILELRGKATTELEKRILRPACVAFSESNKIEWRSPTLDPAVDEGLIRKIGNKFKL